MKRILASAGLLALGISGTQAAGMVAGAPMNKPWSISATLRGFYDDNPALIKNNTNDTFGFEVRPAIGVNLNSGQTTFGANYAYTFRYFADRPDSVITPANTDRSSVDHSHEFSTLLMHAFTERFSVDMQDRFVYSQEPTLTNPSGGASTIRNEGTSLVNDGQINFHAQATRLLEIVLGYRNVFFNYDNPAYSQLLDRMEHFAKVDFRWQVTPQTVAVLGYQFKMVDYSKVASEINNNNAHIVTIGVDHNFSPNLMGSVRVGGQWTDYYNRKTDNLSPYADASLRYTYRPNSYLESGFQYHRNQTDASSSGAFDSATTLFYATLHHSFTPQFVGNLTGQVQNSAFNGLGTVNTQEDWIYYLGLMFEYHFTPNFSANLGYNFDLVDSDISNRGYERNRVFMGVTASY